MSSSGVPISRLLSTQFLRQSCRRSLSTPCSGSPGGTHGGTNLSWTGSGSIYATIVRSSPRWSPQFGVRMWKICLHRRWAIPGCCPTWRAGRSDLSDHVRSAMTRAAAVTVSGGAGCPGRAGHCRPCPRRGCRATSAAWPAHEAKKTAPCRIRTGDLRFTSSLGWQADLRQCDEVTG
jgi:hypothetical protein